MTNQTRADVNEKYPHLNPYWMPKMDPEPGGGTGGRDRRTKRRKDADMVRLAKMYLERWTLADMSHELGIAVRTVVTDLNTLRQSWERYVHQAMETHQAEALARIDRIEMMAMIAWEDSRTPIETSTTQRDRLVVPATKDAPEGSQVLKERAGVRRQNRPGDPRFLDKLSWCVEQRCKILGLYKQPDAGGVDENELPRVTPQQARGIAQRAQVVHEVLGDDAQRVPIEADWIRLKDK